MTKKTIEKLGIPSLGAGAPRARKVKVFKRFVETTPALRSVTGMLVGDAIGWLRNRWKRAYIRGAEPALHPQAGLGGHQIAEPQSIKWDNPSASVVPVLLVYLGYMARQNI
jgi:hypothetical protein